MINVKFTTTSEEIPFLKMTPESKGVVNNCQFHIGKNTKQADWWVVAEGLPQKEQVICPPENTVFVAMENEFMKNYDQKFIDQFRWVVTCHRTMEHPRKILTQQAHFSHLFWSRQDPGQSLEDFRNQFKTYDELKVLAPANIPKTKLLSVVTSHKTRTKGQELRNQFIKKMKEHFGDKLDAFSNQPDTFGPDTKVEKFKWNSIAPYKYYLAIENSFVPHYWTSNIGDAFTAGAYPIYYGHPSVTEYFSPDSFTMIDIHDTEGSIKTIERVIEGNYYGKHIEDIWKMRKIYLEKYNMFAMATDVINSLPSSSKPTALITLRPEQKPAFKLKQYLIKKINKMPGLRSIAKKIYRQYRMARYGHQ